MGLLCAGLLAVGCAAESGVPAPTSSPDTEAAQTPTPTASPTSDTPRERALAAWHTYLDALGAAMRRGNPQLPALQKAAAGQGFGLAQARVAHFSGQTVKGEYESDPALSVDLRDDSTATVNDCVQLPTILKDGEPESGSEDRYTIAGTLERRRARWVVTDVKIAGERCAPEAIAAEVERAYRDAERTWELASAHPGNEDYRQQLHEHVRGEQWIAHVKQLNELESQNQAIRGRAELHPEVTQVRDGDTVAIVRDCQEVRPAGSEGVRTVSRESGEITARPKKGERLLWHVQMELRDNKWVVVNTDVEMGDNPCG